MKKYLKKVVKDFLTRLRIWFYWRVTLTHDEEYRCGNIQFDLRLSWVFLFFRDLQSYQYDISEAEYLYDSDAAILRKYRDYVVPSEKARRAIKK